MNYIVIIFGISLVSAMKEENSTLNATSGSEVNPVSTSNSSDIHPAIVQGFLANIREFPYALRLYVHTRKALSTCTTQAVHVRLVLTAAHCVEGGGRMILVGGEANQDDFVHGLDLQKYARYRVSSVFVHPRYHKDLYDHDVALAKTSRPLDHFGLQLVPISYDKLQVPAKITIFGWGGTETNRHNNKLYGKYLQADDCPGSLYNPRGYLCLIGKGICQGDSGGGLIHNGSIYGIASFYQKSRESPSCVYGEKYVYTSLATEKHFVREGIQRNGTNYNRCFYLTSLVVFITLLQNLLITIC